MQANIIVEMAECYFSQMDNLVSKLNAGHVPKVWTVLPKGAHIRIDHSQNIPF
jgi:hypothetical protein